MLRRTLVAGVASAALAFGFAGGVAYAQTKIAVVGPMTGEDAAGGEQLRHGAEQAVADLNAKGGVMGQKLELEVGDDACDPKQSRSVAGKLAGEGIKFVDGHYCSSASIPASEVYAEEGMLQITPASTNPTFTDRGLWNTFRTCGRDDQQGKVAGAFLAKEFKGRKIAILDDNTTYGKGLADETKKALNAAGVKEAMHESYVKGEKDFSALVSRMKSAGIDVIYIGGYHTEVGLITRQAREQGLTGTIMSADDLPTKEFWQITGPAGEGVIFTFPPDPRKRPTAAAVVKEFSDKNINPEGYTLYSYAAIQVWAGAVEKAKSIEPKKLAETLKSGASFDSVLGPLSYDKNGDITKINYTFYVWHDGDYHEM
jgi:branched-chain amino acid transport system substrate-binding protein